jgi:predicted PurR-regulated permease PerM
MNVDDLAKLILSISVSIAILIIAVSLSNLIRQAAQIIKSTKHSIDKINSMTDLLNTVTKSFDVIISVIKKIF